MDLPFGWTEQTDPGSGSKYYYNAGSGETTWERPKGVAAAGTGSLPEGWAEHSDPGSGRTFYYKAATQETSWEKPQEAAKVDATWSAAQACHLGKELKMNVLGQRVQILEKVSWSSVLRTVDALNDGSLAVALGMCVLFSKSKNSYWLLWRGDKSKEADQIFEDWENPSFTAQPAASAAAGGLPPGWAEHQDPGSGRTFYYNATLGETSWEKPQAAGAAASALPDGWVEHADPGTGKTFYHKASTGETSWEKPQAAAGSGGSLPDGWVEHHDAGSGRAFYYKAATGETAWEKPQDTLGGALEVRVNRGDRDTEYSDVASRASRRSELLKKSAW